jgi:carbon-monoxide dehydrogenase small subunit
MIMTAKSLLDENRRPTEEQVKAYMNGNICRCTGYKKIVEAILAASGQD